MVCIFNCCAEQDSVGISFDQASYTVAEGSSLTITGRLTGLLGEIETAFSNSLLMDFTIDSLTGKPHNN